MRAILLYLIVILEAVLLVRVILSWFHLERKHALLSRFTTIVDLILTPIRKVIPIHHWGIDFSPVILFLILDLIKRSFLL